MKVIESEEEESSYDSSIDGGDSDDEQRMYDEIQKMIVVQ